MSWTFLKLGMMNIYCCHDKSLFMLQYGYTPNLGPCNICSNENKRGIFDNNAFHLGMANFVVVSQLLVIKSICSIAIFLVSELYCLLYSFALDISVST